MTENPSDDKEPGQHHWWALYIVPTASGLESFLWRVIWFALILRILSVI